MMTHEARVVCCVLTQHSGSLLPLRLHLHLQRAVHGGGQRDVAHLVARAHDAPGLAGRVDAHHDGAAEGLALLADGVHAEPGDLGPGGGLGELHHGVLGVLHLVARLDRVRDVQEHDPVNFYCDII